MLISGFALHLHGYLGCFPVEAKLPKVPEVDVQLTPTLPVLASLAETVSTGVFLTTSVPFME